MENPKEKKKFFSITKKPKYQKLSTSDLIDFQQDSSSNILTPIQSSNYNSILINNKNNLILINNNINNNTNIIKLNVILNYSYQKEYFCFIIPARKKYNCSSQKFQFCINDIIDRIYHHYSKINIKILIDENYVISYYINTTDEKTKSLNDRIYFSLGPFPLYQDEYHYLDIPIDNTVYLKFRQIINKEMHLRYDLYDQENELENNEKRKSGLVINNIDSKRAKEKTIDYIIRKVFEWNEYRNETKNKMSKIEAAYIVGLSKKTLDEYLFQIKEGHEHGFNFNKFKFYKVNTLRGYVKGHKLLQNKRKKNNNNNINNTRNERNNTTQNKENRRNL